MRDPGAAAPDHRPRLVVSACLELEPCRYNGQTIRARFLHRLAEHVQLIPVCPEVEIGLGVPRPPVRLVQVGGETRLVQPATERDVTPMMEDFSARFLAGVGEADGFLLKSRSPSCGPKDVKVYAESGGPHGTRGSGLFAAAVARAFPRAPLEDEGRLTNYHLRHHFLTRLFQGARLRALPVTMGALVAFHASSKMLLLAHSEEGMRVLGRVVANAEGAPAAEVRRHYEEGFAAALARPARPGPVVNTLLHASGHFSEALSPAEKALFLSLVDDYRRRRASLDAPLALIRGWTARHGAPWVAGQSFFDPYPAALHDLSDSAGSLPS